MQNEKAANSFTKYVREVLNRLKQFFEKIIGTKSQSDPSKIMANQSAEFISELQKRYDAALLAVKEGNAARGMQKVDGKVKEQKRESKGFFIEDKYFARQIDNWDELKSGGYITVGQIVENSPLNLVGAPVGILYFDNDKIQATMEAHDDHLTTADMKKVPQLLNHPIVITEYKPNQGTNTMSVYGNFTTESGTPIVVGIVITKGVNKNVITKIRTVHARGDFEKQITDKSVLFLGEDKKETKACGSDSSASKCL